MIKRNTRLIIPLMRSPCCYFFRWCCNLLCSERKFPLILILVSWPTPLLAMIYPPLFSPYIPSCLLIFSPLLPPLPSLSSLISPFPYNREKFPFVPCHSVPPYTAPSPSSPIPSAFLLQTSFYRRFLASPYRPARVARPAPLGSGLTRPACKPGGRGGDDNTVISARLYLAPTMPTDHRSDFVVQVIKDFPPNSIFASRNNNN